MKKIVIFMLEVGSGHKMPAEAVLNEIKEMYPDIEVKMYNFAKALKVEKFEKKILRWWRYMLRYPKILKVIYTFSENKHTTVHKFDYLFTKYIEKKMVEFLNKEKPGLVFSTHSTPANLIARLKRKGDINVKDVLLIADAMEAHPIWVEGNSDYYIFSSNKLKEKLIKNGLNQEKLKIMSFPLRKMFTKDVLNTLDKNAIKKKIGINNNNIILLVMSGGEGVGQIEKQIKQIIRKDLKVNVLIVSGRNEKLYKRMLKLRENYKSNNTKIFPFGFVDNIHELMFVSTITSGKSGPSFTFESLIYEKPILITQYVENEKGIKNFIIENNLGWLATSIDKQIEVLERIIFDKQYLNDYINNVKNLDIKNGAKEIAKFLVSLL